MKAFFTMILLIALVPLCGLWATGEKEGTATGPVAPAAAKMDKIVLLWANYHDSDQSVRDAWIKEFKRITGVDLEMKTVSSKDASEGMMTQFMAGTFPDICKYGGESMSALARQEFVVPLDPFIEKSGMKKLKEMFPSAFQAHSVNGVSYGIPEVAGAKRSLWVRTDILDKLGIAMPTTLDELVACLKKIRDGYPTPDGGKMYPYISKMEHEDYASGISFYFDVSISSVWRRPDEKEFRCGWDSPQFPDYAKFMKMMWDEHLIDPQHALPQKATETRSKFYAGKGAFLMMHTHLYEELVKDLRKNFPKAELAVVPPIVNPKGGGVLGSSLSPGYRPFCIMSKAANPQFVWDKVIETLYLTVDGVMLFSRGIPNVSYRVENGLMVDNGDKSGDHMGARSPLNPDIVFPFKMAGLTQKGADIETQFDRWFAKYGNSMVGLGPTVTLPESMQYGGDMGDKMHELFWKYVMGQHTYEQMMSQFEAYKKEVKFDERLRMFNELSKSQ
jgi:ABC-type glycerol-3-phosphate transport system substrate-binding protein